VFRPLRFVRRKEMITLATIDRENRYQVVSIDVVSPSDIRSLYQTGRDTLTGSERESDRSAILGCFLDSADGDEFNVSHGDPLGLQEQVA
jgi:hypothetical protein